MASGILTVPAPNLPGVIRVIRVGLLCLVTEGELSPTDAVYTNLVKWCNSMETYLALLKDKGNGGHTH